MQQTAKTLPIYRQIEEYVKTLIEQNQHNPDYKLPSENQLASKFNASRITVQKALNNLQDAGIIYRMQGKGTFINLNKNKLDSTSMKTVYLLLPDIERRYSREVIKGAHEFLHENDINLSIAMTNNEPNLEKKKIELAINQHCLGIILFPVVHLTYHEALLKLALANYPLVLVGHKLPGLNFSSIHCDYYQQIYDTVTDLIKKGHKHIGYISEISKNNTTFQDRIRGYKDCLIAHFGLQAVQHIELDFYPEGSQAVNRQEIKHTIENFLDKNSKITALITTNLALEYMLEYIDIHPEKKNLLISLIDEPEYVGLTRNRNVMIINQDPKTIGRNAAEQLLDQIQNGAGPKEIITNYHLDMSL